MSTIPLRLGLNILEEQDKKRGSRRKKERNKSQIVQVRRKAYLRSFSKENLWHFVEGNGAIKNVKLLLSTFKS